MLLLELCMFFLNCVLKNETKSQYSVRWTHTYTSASILLLSSLVYDKLVKFASFFKNLLLEC